MLTHDQTGLTSLVDMLMNRLWKTSEERHQLEQYHQPTHKVCGPLNKNRWKVQLILAWRSSPDNILFAIFLHGQLQMRSVPDLAPGPPVTEVNFSHP